jgi:beta-RFAP synthase
MQSVTVRAPARLHLGFLDLNASIGRRFGSIGLAVDSHHTQLTVSRSENLQIEGSALLPESRSRLEKIHHRFYQTVGKSIPSEQQSVRIQVDELIPEHAGLGSGTQLALTLGTALARLHQLSLSTAELAMELGRGKRSGIGIATFDQGGFVLDGGLKPNQTVPPMLMHQSYPTDWRVVMVMDPHHQGIHGQHEKQAFGNLPTFPLDNARAICHLTLMQLLPALAEHDIKHFGSAITEIQALIGDHFASAQGGRYTSPLVAACLQQAQKLGHTGIAQSSWGPTGCIFVSSQAEAEQLIQQLNTFIAAESTTVPVFITAAADNQGAIIETVV